MQDVGGGIIHFFQGLNERAVFSCSLFSGRICLLFLFARFILLFCTNWHVLFSFEVLSLRSRKHVNTYINLIYYEEILFVWVFFGAVPACYGCGG